MGASLARESIGIAAAPSHLCVVQRATFTQFSPSHILMHTALVTFVTHVMLVTYVALRVEVTYVALMAEVAYVTPGVGHTYNPNGSGHIRHAWGSGQRVCYPPVQPVCAGWRGICIPGQFGKSDCSAEPPIIWQFRGIVCASRKASHHNRKALLWRLASCTVLQAVAVLSSSCSLGTL